MKAARKTRTQRTYNSPLREEQSNRTRDLILESAAAQLAEAGPEGSAIPLVAKRARIAVRTIYRYFPTQAALFDALAGWVDERVGNFKYPGTPEDIPELIEGLFPAFDRNALLLRAQLVNPAWRAVRAQARRKRSQALRENLHPITQHLPPDEALQAVAVLRYLMSADAWNAMRQDYDLDGTQSGKAAAWALRLLLNDVRRRNEEAARTKTATAPSERQEK